MILQKLFVLLNGVNLKSLITHVLNLLIITPLLPPAVGGGGIYTELLTHGLLQQDYECRIIILTESYPGFPSEEISENGRLIVKRIFPFRAGVSNKEWNRYLKYAYQNLQFYSLQSLIQKYEVTNVLIHSSFHNYFSVLTKRFLKFLKKTTNVQLISDVRDPKLPRNKFYRLYPYDHVICCSINVYDHLAQDSELLSKLVYIPILVDIQIPTTSQIDECKKKYCLNNKNYIINNSGISKEKGIDLLIDVVYKLREMDEDIILAVSGKRRDWSANHQRTFDEGILCYLGTIPHSDALCLSAGSSIDINLSTVDSMPRASLEAIAVGAKVILPQGVPEFQQSCPENIVSSNSSEVIALQIRKILTKEKYKLNFDIDLHSSKKIIPQYLKLFRSA